MKLKDQNALVTGGLRGIGRAVTDRLLAEGAHVFVTDLDASGDDLTHPNATYMQADVSSEDDWKQLIVAISDKVSMLHVLVNNAGRDGVGPVEDMSIDLWRQVFAVNSDGAFLATKHCHKLLAKGGADRMGGSSIINVSSIMGKVGFTDTSAYNASKGALKLFTKASAIEFANKKTPIRVNSVHPGFVTTPLLQKGLQQLADSGVAGSVDEVSGALAGMTPMGRVAAPEEIANVVMFLASEEASYMTGSELYVDGGWTAQ